MRSPSGAGSIFRTSKEELLQKAMNMFEVVLAEEDGNPRHLDALLGRAKLLEKFK